MIRAIRFMFSVGSGNYDRNGDEWLATFSEIREFLIIFHSNEMKSAEADVDGDVDV